MLRTYHWVINVLFKTHPLATSYILLGILWGGGFTVLSLKLIQYTFDSAISFIQTENHFWLGPGKWLSIYLGVLLINIIIVYSNDWVRKKVERNIRLRMHEQIFNKVSTYSIISFEDPKFYDEMYRARAGLNDGLLVMILSTASIITAIFSSIAIALMVASYSWLLLVSLLLVNIPSIIARLKFIHRLYDLNRLNTQTQREAGYFKSCLFNKQLAKEIRVFNIGNYFIDQWLERINAYLHKRMKIVMKRETVALMIELATSIFYIVSVLIIAKITIQDSLTIGIFIALIHAIQLLQQQVEMITSQLGLVAQCAKSVGDTYHFLHEGHSEYNQASTLGDKTVHPISTIEFKNVSFKYPRSHKYAIHNVSFTLHAGEKTVLVGANGAGKSTLVKLMTGLYTPTEGRIFINGSDMKDLDIKSLYRHVSAVFQDFACYHLTLRHNIGFGDIRELGNDERIREAANKTQADQVLDQLGQNLDVQLGQQFSDGVELSIGQWQRLAMARSHFREAGLIVLDEPVASLDAKAEAQLYQLLHSLSHDKMSVFVSHRIGYATLADRILVLHQGELREEGTHQELIGKQDGIYQQYFTIQAAAYR